MKKELENKRRSPKDDGSLIKESEWEEAVELLLKKIQYQTWLSLKKSASIMPRDWVRLFHMVVGPAIRNLLSAYGFKWGENCLDSNIPFLLEDAINRVEEDTVYFHATVYIID